MIAPLPGAGAADVAEQVTKPIERAISGVPRLEALQSTSANSLSLVIAQFSFGTDIKEARAQIEQSLQAANLPQTVEPTVSALNINASPVIVASIAATTTDGLSEAARIVQTEIEPALLGIEGVAGVDVSGGEEQQVRITLDPAKLAAANVSESPGRRRPDREQPHDPVGPDPGRRHEDAGLDDRRVSAASTRSGDLVVGVQAPVVAPGAAARPAPPPTPAPRRTPARRRPRHRSPPSPSPSATSARSRSRARPRPATRAPRRPRRAAARP